MSAPAKTFGADGRARSHSRARVYNIIIGAPSVEALIEKAIAWAGSVEERARARGAQVAETRAPD